MKYWNTCATPTILTFNPERLACLFFINLLKLLHFMICFNVSLFMVVAFLLLTLMVGIYFSFSRKATTLREYAVGNKQFSTATLVATVLATNFGGSGLLRNVQQVHKLGLYWIIIYLLIIFRLWTMGWLALRMGPFMKHLSMAETIGSVYGKYPRIITALLSICKSIIAITSQIVVMTEAISICVEFIDPCIITTLAALFLIFYATFGGIRSVTFTDILQFITFAIIIPLLAWFMFVKVGKPATAIIPLLQSQSKFQFTSLSNFDTKLINMGAIILCCLTPCIEPSMIQRIYMTSGPIQAEKVFSYAAIFSFVIRIFIVLTALFVFVGEPDLTVKEIWAYIMSNIPSILKGFVAISLLAMAMSTADSELNSCAIMFSHDIVKNIHKEKEISDCDQLKIARCTTIVVGLLAMIVAFYCKDLLKLMFWTLDLDVIVVAPFLLAVFRFRGTSRVALIGMATGALSILSWNKWIKPIIGINGAFVCMLINILATIVAHYLLKQPESAGWVDPDYQFKQIQQENSRKKAEQKEKIKNSWTNKKNTLAKLQPHRSTLTYIGCYIIISNLLTYFIASISGYSYWLIFQILLGGCFLGYSTFISEKIQHIPGWVIGLFWVMGLTFCLPINVLWHWWHGTNFFLTLGLSLAHLAVTLLVLPLYLGVGFLMVTLFMAICLSSFYCTKPLVLVLSPSTVALLLLLCLGLGLLIFGIFVYLKAKNHSYSDQIIYLKDQEKIRENQKLKASFYEATLVSSNRATSPKLRGYGFVLTQVVRKIEESISFLDSNMPLYKQDFQSIINKFYDWVVYFNKKEMAKDHALLQPTKITLDKLIRKVEVALYQEVADPPRLLIEKTSDPNGGLCSDIVCDVNQVVYVLVQTVLRVGKLEDSNAPVVRIQLHPTVLQFKQTDPVDGSDPVCLLFQSTALVISQATTPADLLPKVKASYDDVINCTASQERKEAPPSIDLQQQTISNVIGAHYGCLEDASDQKQPTMLLVLPNDVTEILGKITTTLPIDALTLETPVTPKEQADSMMVLMQFHDYVCKASLQEDPIDMKTISGLLLLLRKKFGFKRHESGQLFYVRAVGIATLVVEWVFHSPKVIYAALLYGLVRRTCLPLSYIKEHYNFGVYAFVLNVVGIDKRQALDHPSLLHVKNRLKEAIKEEHVQLSVLFIKLAERLYDLRHAAGYIHLTEVQHMAQETLAIDVQIAHTYLAPEIGVALEESAKQALEVCKSKEAEREKEKNKDKDKDS